MKKTPSDPPKFSDLTAVDGVLYESHRVTIGKCRHCAAERDRALCDKLPDCWKHRPDGRIDYYIWMHAVIG